MEMFVLGPLSSRLHRRRGRDPFRRREGLITILSLLYPCCSVAALPCLVVVVCVPQGLATGCHVTSVYCVLAVAQLGESFVLPGRFFVFVF